MPGPLFIFLLVFHVAFVSICIIYLKDQLVHDLLSLLGSYREEETPLNIIICKQAVEFIVYYHTEAVKNNFFNKRTLKEPLQVYRIQNRNCYSGTVASDTNLCALFYQ